MVDRLERIYNESVTGPSHKRSRPRRIGSVTHTFEPLVNETEDIETLLKDVELDRVNGYITSKKSPVKKVGRRNKELSVCLFQVSMSLPLDLIVKEMREVGYRPGGIHLLVALIRENPELQKDFSIIAPVSFCQVGGYKYVPLLHRGTRYLDLDYQGKSFGEDYRFICVPRVTR